MNQKIYGFSTELRAVGDGEAMTLEGRAIVFNQPTVLCEIDGIKYQEIISSKALDKTDVSDVVLRYNHQGNFIVLARTRNKSLTLEKRLDGLYMKASLQKDVQAHVDIYNSVKSGLVDKMSFGFVADSENYDQGTHTRTVETISRLYDVSIVDQPAYENTFVEARSRFEQYANVDTYRESLIIKSKILKARMLL